MTPEGIENNPVMYELVMELPWREHRFTRDEWLKGYVYAVSYTHLRNGAGF